MNKKKVMLICEGTYPFNGGGVSTWCHILCEKIRNADFILYSMNASFESLPKYKITENVLSIIQLPLWTPNEPYEYVGYGEEYYKTIGRKLETTGAVIKAKFIPLFEQFLQIVYQDQHNVGELDEVCKALWMYFKRYDYKRTMRSTHVWKSFTATMKKYSEPQKNADASLIDMTLGLRWIYHFLLPFSVSRVPKVDIAHLTLSGFTIIPALIANYRYGARIMLTEHGVFIRERLLAINNSEYPFFLKNLLIRLSEAIAKLVYHKCDAIVSVNQFNQKWEKRYGADPRKLSVIYNGIDHNLFKPRHKPAHLEGIPTVVAAARIFELKDIITMIRSCAVVQMAIPNVQYLIYGDNNTVPSYTQECEALIAELGLEKNFRLMGMHNDPKMIYIEGDISILTSISEGFPYTILESMGCGVPVVATDVGGVSEALDSTTGIICKPKDAKQIGEGVIRLLQDEKLRKEMGANCRKRILQEFTLEKINHQYEEMYDSLGKIDSDESSSFNLSSA